MTAPRGTPPPAAPAAPNTTDEAAPALAAAVLASSPADPRVTALCRWAVAADVAGLRRELVEARVEAALAHDDFVRMRALHHDRAPAPGGDPDTIDDALSDAVPIALEDEDATAACQVPTLRIQRPAPRPVLRPTRLLMADG